MSIAILKDEDLNAASDIVVKHEDLNDGEPLDIVQVHFGAGEAIDLCLSDWVSELFQHFQSQYGLQHGIRMTNAVLIRYAHQDETFH